MGVIQAVVFDYGHTLVDFAPAEDRMFEAYETIRSLLVAEAKRDLPQAPEMVLALSRRVEEMVEESYRNRELEEVDIVDLFEEALAAMDVTLPRDVVRGVAEMEHRAMVSRLEVSEENLAVLAALRSRDLRIGLVSNAHFLPELMRDDIARLGIAQYVDDAVFSAEIGVRKPHPAIFRKVLGEIGVEPSVAVFVGDRVRDDIGGAKALGMRAVLTREFRQEEVRDGAAKPDFVIERLPDLLSYIDELLGQRDGSVNRAE